MWCVRKRRTPVLLRSHGYVEILCLHICRPMSSSSLCSGRIRFDSCSLYPQNEIGPSISSSVVLCVFVLLVYIVVLVYVSCLCPSSICVVATFPGTVLFPLLYSLLLFFPSYIGFFYLVLLFQEVVLKIHLCCF